MQSIDSDDTAGSPPTSVALQYPALPINDRLAQLLANPWAGKMAENLDTNSDDNSSTLGDSAYEILGDSAILTSEDEDTTESLASVEAPRPDDVASIVGSDDTDGQETASNSSQADSHVLPMPDRLRQSFAEDEGTDSSLTVKGTSSVPDPSIIFEEPHQGNGEGHIAVTHTIRTFSEQETSEIIQHIRTDQPPTQLTATVRQIMTRRGLVVKEPFRVVYVGHPMFKDDIVAKIGAAMAVPVDQGFNSYPSARSSRYNVVPVSSFGGGTPEVELIDSVGIELVVDECTSVDIADSYETMDLSLNGRHACTSRCRDGSYRFNSPVDWKLPHIAIFVCADGDDVESKVNRQRARVFMARHSIPSIFISQKALYTHPALRFSLDHASIHMCLESPGSDMSEGRVLRRLPIDLSTFLNIDAGQMNRNLAYLTGLYDHRDSEGWSEPKASHISQSLQNTDMAGRMSVPSKYLTSTLKELRSTTKGINGLVILGLILLCGFMVSMSTYQKLVQTGFGMREGPGRIITASTSAMSHTSDLTSPLPRASGLSVQPEGRLSTVVKSDIEGLFFDSSLSVQSDKFQMHKLGDSHMILKPPQRWISLRKQPDLYISVSRNGKFIDIDCSKMFDGVYALRLDRKDAYGKLVVSIHTNGLPVSRPFAEQKFELDFGSPWLKVAGWQRAARKLSLHIWKDIRSAQTDAKIVLNQMAADLRSGIAHASEGAQYLRSQAKLLEVESRRFAEKGLEMTKGTSQCARKLSRELFDRSAAMTEDIFLYADKMSIALRHRILKSYHSARVRDITRSWRPKRTGPLGRAQQRAARLWQSHRI
ncbi:MAG: hypothetical protein M1819_005120 [Sarea resinae]|nr:MAG: hypothetical protein M1819_005120 [Sarea resinae]